MVALIIAVFPLTPGNAVFNTSLNCYITEAEMRPASVNKNLVQTWKNN